MVSMQKKSKRDLDNYDVLSLNEEDILKGMSIDCVVIGFHDKNLKVLLNRFTGYHKWMLPGGFIFKDEDIEDAAHRILRIRTGLENVYLRQFAVFGDYNRVSLKDSIDSLYSNNISDDKIHNHWLLQRFISAGYYALVDYTRVRITNSPLDEAKWFDVKDIPPVLFGDHKLVIEEGLNTIREHLNTIPLDYELLPKVFTMTELRSVYETILDKKLDRRNFQKSMLQTDYIVKQKETRGRNQYKPTILYSFDKEKYLKALENNAIQQISKPRVSDLKY